SAGEEEHIQAVSFTPSSNLTTGDTVTLRIKPKGSYQLSGMALRKATDPAAIPQDISSDFTKLSEDTYRFVMPDYDARVDFKCEPTNEVTAGDFVVKNANCNFNYDEHYRHLELSGNGRATITMRPGVTSTSDRIWVEPDANINLTIKDLTISSSRECLYFSYIGECRLILEGNNRLTSNAAKKPAIYKNDIGKLTITGSGKLTATALGNQSCGIGGFAQCKGLSIAGGTIYAQGNNAMGIGYAGSDTHHESAIYYQGGTVKSEYIGLPNNSFGGITGTKANVVITGGSIRPVNSTASIQSHKIPENGQGTKVYLTTITLGNGATLAKQAYVTALTGADTYGINDMYTDEEGKLYLWLPNGTAVTKVETEQGSYIGSVTANDNNHLGDAAAVFTLEKRPGQGSVALSGWRYGETAKTPVPTSTTNGTANVSYTYFTDEACTTKTTRDNSGADSIGSVPRNVGRYWVQATFAETPRYKAVIAKAGFAISKATVSFTPPTPKTGLTYTGETQELINAGTVDTGIGKLTYSLSETGTYSETIPRAQDAGTYRVYYKVVGTNANYDYTNAKGDIEVSIGKVSITPTVAISGWTYGASPNAPTLTGNTGGGAVTYDYFTDEACTTKTTAANGGAESTGGVPKNAGKYWVKATIAETANYTAATAKATFAIKKAEVSFTPPNPKTDLSYTGELQELINAGSVDSNIGKMQYSLSETGTYSETIPTAKDVGSYSVYYKVVGTNANYDYSNAKGSVDVSIHKTYEVTVTDGTGSGKYAEGETVSIKANDKSGYTFIGWTGDDGVVFDNASAKETSFVMPAKNITVTANYRSNSSGGSSGGGSGGSGGSNTSKDDVSIIIKTEKAPDLPTTAEIIVKAKKGNDKTATAEISEKTVENAIKKAQEEAKKKGKESNGIAIEINIAMPRGTDKVKMNLSENTLGKMVSGEVKHLIVNGSFVKVVFDKNAVFGIKKQSKGDVLVTIIPMKKLSKEPKKLIGNRPVYDISLSNGNGKKITDFGNGTATVLLSYKLEKTETIGGLYAVYVDEKERAFRIDPSAYDVNSGSVIFATNHLSVYGVGYTAPSQRFDDTKKHWAKDFIDYVVGRGLLDGSRENKFYPNEKMTRGMLVTALGKLAGVNVKKYETNSFTDVQNDSFYHPYIEWAYSKGVVYGIGDGTFAPDKSITREEMAVIFERYAKVTGCKIPVTREASVYEDKENIGIEYRESVKAMQQAGIMMGIDGNKFNPKGNATRAEVSAMLSRYIKLTITPETAQGFVLDDAGKYHYYKDGKALTGKQTLDGTVYFFDESGVLQIGWVKDGNIWRYYDGTKAHKGWLNLKVEGEERIYYLNREGLLESGKWVKIDGKWYYFYPDGTLAVNTEIDGYKVDGKGVRKEK
uniref:S-layer homology domain-containing protein n=1 Tax=Filifactor alocis TaxID=143361 RepID=UPI0028D8059C